MSGDHNMHCSANQPDKETPLALRLAEWLDEEYMYFPDDNNKRIAAELRRLYEVNAELVEALERMLSDVDSESFLFDGGNGLSVLTYNQARATLAKAKGESNEQTTDGTC